jgi:hypothetical protein
MMNANKKRRLNTNKEIMSNNSNNENKDEKYDKSNNQNIMMMQHLVKHMEALTINRIYEIDNEKNNKTTTC